MIMIKKTGEKRLFINSQSFSLRNKSIARMINYAKTYQLINPNKQITITF